MHLIVEDGIRHAPGFFAFGGIAYHFDFLTDVVGGPNVFLQLLLVVLDHRTGCIHNVLGGSVILLKFERFYVWVIAFIVEDVLDIGATKGINTLRVIAHHANVLMHCGQLARDHVLHMVGILILVYHDVFELMLPFVTNIHVVVEQFVGVEQNVVEIHGSGFKATVGIFHVNFRKLCPVGGFVLVHQLLFIEVVFGFDQVVFRHANSPQNHGGFVGFIVKVHFFDDALE